MSLLLLTDILLWFIIQFIISIVISILPDGIFNPEGFLFKCREWENQGKIYEELFKIRSWKTKLPVSHDLSYEVINLRELRLNGTKHIKRYLSKSCKAEAIHILASFIMIVFIFRYDLLVTLIIVMITSLINIPFVIIQRYNRPRLIKYLDRLN